MICFNTVIYCCTVCVLCRKQLDRFMLGAAKKRLLKLRIDMLEKVGKNERKRIKREEKFKKQTQ